MDNNIIENLNEDQLIQSYLIAIDNRNKDEVEFLFNKANEYNIKKDIVFEMYNRYQLNSKRLEFIMEQCTAYLNISSKLVKKLMKNNYKQLLEIIFNHFNFFLIIYLF